MGIIHIDQCACNDNEVIDLLYVYQTTSCLVCSLSAFGARTNHGKHELTRLTTTQTWGKPPPSPLYYTMCMAMGLAPKCHFVPKFPSGNLKISKLGTSATLGAHNFVYTPPIEVRSKEML